MANTTFLTLEGTGRQASNCCAGDNPANKGQTRILPLISYVISNNEYSILLVQKQKLTEKKYLRNLSNIVCEIFYFFLTRQKY